MIFPSEHVGVDTNDSVVIVPVEDTIVSDSFVLRPHALSVHFFKNILRNKPTKSERKDLPESEYKKKLTALFVYQSF